MLTRKATASTARVSSCHSVLRLALLALRAIKWQIQAVLYAKRWPAHIQCVCCIVVSRHAP